MNETSSLACVRHLTWNLISSILLLLLNRIVSLHPRDVTVKQARKAQSAS